MHPFVHIFGLTLPAYGMMMACGIIAAFILLYFERKILPIIDDDYYSIVICALAGGMVGAKLLFWLVNIKTIIANPSFLRDSITSGFVFYGALIGGLLAVFIFTVVKKQNFLTYSDLIVPAVTLGQAFGRIGCFLAGCCYGMEYDGACAVTFPYGVGSSAPAGIALFPTQLLESAFLFVLAFVIYGIFKREKKLGTATAWYLILYSVGRFIIEFFRGDDRGFIGIISTSQFISIVLFMIGVILLALVRKGKTPDRPFPGTFSGESEEEETDKTEETGDIAPSESGESERKEEAGGSDASLKNGESDPVEPIPAETRGEP